VQNPIDLIPSRAWYRLLHKPWLAFVYFVCFVVTSCAAELKTVLFFGDSLTAGLGLEDPSAQAFPALIQKKLDDAGLPWRAVNAGLSGETSAGGLRRVDWILRQRVEMFVLELGGNDGLRGLPPETTRANLQAIIDRVRAKSPTTKIVLVGIAAPPNMGADFTRAFAAIFPELAEKNGVALIPFLLEGVGGRPELNQPDGIHPNVPGHAIVAETVWTVLKPLL
jgi:acyl-CoA thioesterase-1